MSKLPQSFLARTLRRRTCPRLPHRPYGRSRRLPFARTGAFSIALLLLVAGCGERHLPSSVVAACQDLQLCDRPSQPPILTDIGCDVTQGTPCSKEALAETVARVAADAADRPGSRLRLWMLSGTVGTTQMVAEQLVPALPTKGPKGRAESISRLTAATRELFLTAAQPALASPPPRQSPLVESLSKIVLADSHGLTRRVLLISDARQVSSDTADFECGKRLPSEAAWVQLLTKRRLVLPGSLTGTSVIFSYLTAAPSGRCAVSVEREVTIRSLWQVALKRAGAARVSFLSGPADLREPPGPALARQE